MNHFGLAHHTFHAYREAVHKVDNTKNRLETLKHDLGSTLVNDLLAQSKTLGDAQYRPDPSKLSCMFINQLEFTEPAHLFSDPTRNSCFDNLWADEKNEEGALWIGWDSCKEPISPSFFINESLDLEIERSVTFNGNQCLC